MLLLRHYILYSCDFTSYNVTLYTVLSHDETFFFILQCDHISQCDFFNFTVCLYITEMSFVLFCNVSLSHNVTLYKNLSHYVTFFILQCDFISAKCIILS